MNTTAASVIVAIVVALAATVAAIFHVLSSDALAAIYGSIITGGVGYKLGQTNGGT